jgi:hypothetical protein
MNERAAPAAAPEEEPKGLVSVTVLEESTAQPELELMPDGLSTVHGPGPVSFMLLGNTMAIFEL